MDLQIKIDLHDLIVKLENELVNGGVKDEQGLAKVFQKEKDIVDYVEKLLKE